MISFSYLPLIRYYLIISAILTSSIALAQTTTTADGNWNTGANWDNGVPASGDLATVEDSMTLDVNITISTGGSIIVNGGKIVDPAIDNDLTISGDGFLEVGGNVTIGGDFNINNSGSFTIKGCDTLRVRGDIEVRNSSNYIIESCGVLYIEGNALFRNTSTANVDGNIYVEGDLTIRNTSSISGSGNLEVEGEVNINNSADIFGNTTACTPGPCEYGSGQGLPINLEGLNASYISSSAIKVDWTTISEINNDYFTLFISTNGDQFVEAKRIMGSGNSYSRKSYQSTLNDLGKEINYLKLKQTDFDGQFEEFGPFRVSKLKQQTSKEELLLIPNPGNGRDLTIQLNNIAKGSYSVELVNLSGKVLINQAIEVQETNNSTQINLTIGSELPKGIYYVRVYSAKSKLSRIYIVQ